MKKGAGQQDFVDTMTEVVGRWHGSWQDPAIAESKALAYRVRLAGPPARDRPQA